MRIVIVGTGGVGGYFGARLAMGGNNVTFIARSEHLEAIQQNGLIVKSPMGEFSVKPAQATDQYNVVKAADLVLIATKAWQVKQVAHTIAPFIQKETMVLPMQNGVMAAEELSEFIPKKNIIGGLCRIFSKIEAPGIIRHMGSEPTIVFGELDNQRTERAAWIKYTFDMIGVKNIWADDINVELWKKFLMICSSALLAVTRTTYDELRSIPETRKMLEGLFTEIYNVGKATGVQLPDTIIAKTMKAVDNFPVGSTSSLTRDVWDGKPSEIDYQNGTVVKLGKAHNVPTPINQYVYHTILPMEQKARR